MLGLLTNVIRIFMLPDQDSNLDKRYQKPSYYHYTIRQSPFVYMSFPKWNANIRRNFKSQNQNFKFLIFFKIGLWWFKIPL